MKHHRPHYDNKAGKDSQPRRYDVEKFRSNYDNIFRKRELTDEELDKAFFTARKEEFRGTGPPQLDAARIGSVDSYGRRYMGHGCCEHISHQVP